MSSRRRRSQGCQTSNTLNKPFRYSCLNGQKLLTKVDFAAGISTNLLDTLSSTCLVSGWFNDTIGGFTCTKFCGEPANYTVMMQNDWDGKLPVANGKQIK